MRDTHSLGSIPRGIPSIRYRFEAQLGKIYDRHVHRVQTLDFDELTEDMDKVLTKRLRMQHINTEGLHTVKETEIDGFKAYWDASLRVIASKNELVDYWTWISSNGDFLGATPSYNLIREPLRRLFHRLIMFAIASRGHKPKKVTTTDLFYLRSMDEEMVVNVPYLHAHYLFRFASRRKRGAQMYEGKQRELLERMSNDQARFSTWMVGRMTKLIEQSGMRYVRFDGTNIRDS
nr:hypothetical protein [Tanacetum cinerariifolium]